MPVGTQLQGMSEKAMPRSTPAFGCSLAGYRVSLAAHYRSMDDFASYTFGTLVAHHHTFPDLPDIGRTLAILEIVSLTVLRLLLIVVHRVRSLWLVW